MGTDKRPPFRWFLIGPERSGTTVHIDPLNTSAWNTSLQGHKLYFHNKFVQFRWVLFPPETPKEIVKGKKYLEKGDEYEAIVYFEKILPKIKKNDQVKTYEFIQKAGKV
jgi:histone arginine demethylase JMJD6